MKKKLTVIVTFVLLLGTILTVCASAKDAVHEVNRDLIYKAAYGTPVVDGVMDSIYLQSDVMYAENVSFGSSASVKSGDNATAEYYIVWNETTLFIFCTVTDSTRSDPGAVDASASKMDNTDIYVILDENFDIANDYSDRTNNSSSGQFRFQPTCTIENEPKRKDWGGLTTLNQMFQTLNYKGGYLNETDGSYSFEMSIEYSSSFKKAVKTNIKNRVGTKMGLGIQINDVMDNDKSRDALIYSNNAKSGLSSNLKNCGNVLLSIQEGVEFPTESEETTALPVTEESVESNTSNSTPTENSTKPVQGNTEKNPEVTTSSVTTKGEDKTNTGSGCKSSVSVSLAFIAFIGAMGIGVTACKTKH